MSERDPHGMDPHAPGAKLDEGKVKAGLLKLFSRALVEVARVGTFGAAKYTRGGWQHVPNGEERYEDAQWRHLLAEIQEPNDPDSGLPHLAHQAWNALARLELVLRNAETPAVGDHIIHRGLPYRITSSGPLVTRAECRPCPGRPEGEEVLFTTSHLARPVVGVSVRMWAKPESLGTIWVETDEPPVTRAAAEQSAQAPAEGVSAQGHATTGNAAARPSWPEFHMLTAEFFAQRSKDPSTHVGAVAVDASNSILETGYNGLPRRVRDLDERMVRPEKYLWTAHAEANLVSAAARPRLEGSTVFVTHLCCSRCAGQLINAGVTRVVIGNGKTSMPVEEFQVALTMFEEAGVDLTRLGGSPITAEDGTCSS